MSFADFDLLDEFGPYVNLVRIDLRERTLGSSRSSYGYGEMKGPGKIGMHDYIVLTVIIGNRRLFSFVAEKMKTRRLCGGKLSYVRLEPLPEGLPASRSRFVCDLDSPIVSTAELNQILTTNSRHYNMLSDNCWSYAASTVEAVMGLFKEEPGYENALLLLKGVKRSLPRDWLRLLYKPFSHKNLHTWRRIAAWWCDWW